MCTPCHTLPAHCISYQKRLTDNYSIGRADRSDDVSEVPVQLSFHPYIDPKFGVAAYTWVQLVVEILRYNSQSKNT